MKNNFYDSFLYRVWSFLFITNGKWEISKTRVGKIFQKAYIPHLTEVLTIIAVSIYWYEGLIIKYWAGFPSDWLALLGVLLALFFADKEKMVFGKAQLYLLFFYLVLVVSGLVAISQGANPAMIFKGLLLFLQFGLILFTGLNLNRNITKVVIWLSLPLGLIGIYQYLVKIPTSSLWLSPGEKLTRVFAFFGSPNVFGILMAVIFFLSLGFFLKGRKYVYLPLSFVSLFAVGLSYSRSAWLGLALSLGFCLLIYNYKYLMYLPLLLLALVIPQIRNRLLLATSASYLFDSTLDGRLWAINNGLYVFKQYFLIGSGPGSYGGKIALNYASPTYLDGLQRGYTALYFTDNQYLQLLVQSGILGILSFMGFLVASFSSLIRQYGVKKDIMTLTAIGAFSCFVVSGLFANVLEFGAIAIPVGLILGIELGETNLN